MLTAQEAVNNNWTYILCRPGDDLFNVLKTAQLYAPAVVWYEDIDGLAKGGTDEDISKLLDALDGITSKGVEIVACFTTNHVEKIQKGVLRPGRLDAIVEFGFLDQNGITKLVQNLIKPSLLDNVDYSLVFKAFAGFYPAFAAEAINGALRYSIARNGGKVGKISTDDLVNASIGLRRQLNLMDGAVEGANEPTLDSVLQKKLNATFDSAAFEEDNEGRTGLRVIKDRTFDKE
jgi:transitional endoplasmic reticulum ATPase